VAERNVTPILMEGLRRLEYRGYDSAGIAVLDDKDEIDRARTVGKVAVLAEALQARPLAGQTGIAHTRWATHGEPNEGNAHPHLSHDAVAVVHNGIIENFREVRTELEGVGYEFASATDTEVIAHQIHRYLAAGKDLCDAVRTSVHDLRGAYALGVLSKADPQRLIAARSGSPLVIGIGVGERFIGSDVAALVSVTHQFIFLEDGDIADIRRDEVTVYDRNGRRVSRPVTVSELTADAAERGNYRHYMQKEIFEQARAIADTTEGRIHAGRVLDETFGPEAENVFSRIKAVQIIACGTSYHAGLVARNWFEGLARVPCQVEVASEFRYRHPVPGPDTLVVTISQSGETADTLAALRATRKLGYGPSLGIVNAPETSLVRESDLVLMTRAGPEIGVASTKAFTTQLSALLMLVVALGRHHGLSAERASSIVEQLDALPRLINEVLALDDAIESLAARFADKHHALFPAAGCSTRWRWKAR